MEEIELDDAAPTLSPATREAIRQEVRNAPQQPFRGATPRPMLHVVDVEPSTAQFYAAAQEARDGAMTVIPQMAAVVQPQVTQPVLAGQSGMDTVALYRADQARRQLVPRRSNALYLTGRQRVAPLGDKKMIIHGYKEMSLCKTLVSDALHRAYAAIELLDPVHANIIRARLAKAGVTGANASHANVKEITFKKAVSIALQAEAWVFQAQAAAAKHMVKESKSCLHNLAGKRRRTREEKEAAYQARYGMERGTRSERAARKYQKRINELKGNAPAPQ